MPTLKLTDGTTTIDFGNVTTGNYWLYANGYTPKINGLRLESLGGRGIYEDVEETIQFWITDSSAANCYTRLNTLTKLLLQARRFARGEAVSPVKIQYSPDNAAVSSSGSPLEALITYATDDSALGIELSPTFDEASYQYKLKDLSITFRRGVWLQGSEVQTVASTVQGQIASFTFATNVDYMSPTDVYIDALLNGITYPAPFIIVGSGSTSIQIVRAANSTGSPTGTGWTYYNDSGGGNNPRNTNVMRYTPPSTSENSVNCYDTCSLTEGKRYAVIAACRNNSASTSFAVRASIQYPSPHAYPTDYTESRTVKPYVTSAAPGYLSLGTFVAPITDAAVYLQINVTGSAASGSIDFDGIIVIEADNACVIQAQNRSKISSGSNRYEHFWIENRFLDGLTMRTRGKTFYAVEDFVSSRNGGDVLTSGTAVKAIVLSTEGTYWGMGGTVPPSSQSITLTRTRVHLSPE